MTQPIRILLLEDRASDAKLVISALKEADFDPTWERVETREDFERAIAGNWEIILADYSLPQFDTVQALAVLRQHKCSTPLIIVSGTIGEETAVAAMKEGAADYLLKDRLGRLGQAVRQALEQRQFIEAQRRSEQVLLERTRLTMLAAEVSLALSSAGTLPDVLLQCAQSLVNLASLTRVRVWTVNSDQRLSLQASAGDCASSAPDAAQSDVEYKAIIHQIADYQSTEIVARKQDNDSIRSALSLPLMIENRMVGAVEVFSDHQLTPATLSTLSSVANQLAAGIERKRTEERLRFTQFTLDHIATPVLWADGEGQLFNVNNAVCRLSGYAHDELVSLAISDLIPPNSRESWPALWNEVRERGAWATESEFRTKSGAQIPIQVNFNLLIVDGRECCCTFLQDITERKHLEDQFRQAQKMEAVGRLAGGIAHDFNNLLTIILGYCEVVRESLRGGDPIKDSVEQIFIAGNRAARLTRQLLAFSRKQVLAPTILDVNALLHDMEKMLGRLIGEDIELQFHLGSNLWKTRVDPGQVEQIIMNLVVNARDAMPQGGRLVVSTSNTEINALPAAARAEVHPREYVVIQVADTGCGMDEATLARIFEPFFSTKGEQGTGLGLATVYGIVQQSNGHIDVRSSPGGGTTFSIFLPRSAEVERADAKSREHTERAQASGTILLVEDEDGVRMLAKHSLERQGFRVLESRNGNDALLLCEQYQGPIDLLLTDVVMPNMSGRELSERLHQLRPMLNVLYMSGYMDDAIVQHGLLHAQVPFLQKPFTPETLIRKIREVLGNMRPNGAGE